MITTRIQFIFRGTALAALLGCCCSVIVHAAEVGDFNVAYGFSAVGHARTTAPSPTAMAGTASFGVFVSPSFLIAGSTQTFTSTATPGSRRTWSYGLTKFEFNRDWAVPKTKVLHVQADYTIMLPTDGIKTPGVEHYSHQFLGMLDYQRSAQNYFEIDAGDYMGGRDATPGYKHTALLSLIVQHNLRADGGSGTNYDFELDASPSSEGAPASAVLTAGVEHTFKSKVTLTALALVGLTANDPVIGVAVRVKFGGNFAGKPIEARNAMNFSKLQRLERTRFGRIGRF
jgi:hypothetical protein